MPVVRNSNSRASRFRTNPVLVGLNFGLNDQIAKQVIDCPVHKKFIAWDYKTVRSKFKPMIIFVAWQMAFSVNASLIKCSLYQEKNIHTLC